MYARLLAVAVGGALSIALAPAAAADGNTQEFVDAMYDAGVTPALGSESFWVLSAHEQCNAMDDGVPPAEIAAYLAEVNPDLGPQISATIVRLAIGFFCPSHLPPPLPPGPGPQSAPERLV